MVSAPQKHHSEISLHWLTGMSATLDNHKWVSVTNRNSFLQGCDLVSIFRASEFSQLLTDYAWNWKL